MPRQIQQRVDLGHRHAFRSRRHLHDVIPGLHVALLQHPEIEAGPVMCHEHRGHLRLVHPDPDAIAGHPWLRYLEERSADLVPVSDAHPVIGQSADRKVLAELTVFEVVAAELLLPVLVRLNLVHEHRAMLATVAGQVALPVTINVEAPHLLRAANRPLPDRRVHGLAVPVQILRHPHVHRQQGPSAPTGHHSNAPPPRRPKSPCSRIAACDITPAGRTGVVAADD